MKRFNVLLEACCGLLFLVWSFPATAAATLLGELTDTHCSMSSESGVVEVDCLTLWDYSFSGAVGFDVVLQPGQSASVTATLHYTYRDDGLPLTMPGAFQMDANGFDYLYTNFEAGALYGFSNNCRGSRYCPYHPDIFIEGGSVGFPPLLLGLNSVPDHITGVLELSSHVSVPPLYPYGPVGTTVYVEWVAEVRAVPEPGTVLQVAAGLALLAGLIGVARRGAGGV
jgi:hypothetical protein